MNLRLQTCDGTCPSAIGGALQSETIRQNTTNQSPTGTDACIKFASHSLLLFRHDLAEIGDGSKTSEDSVEQVQTAGPNPVVIDHYHDVIEELVQRLADSCNLAKRFVVLTRMASPRDAARSRKGTAEPSCSGQKIDSTEGKG